MEIGVTTHAASRYLQESAHDWTQDPVVLEEARRKLEKSALRCVLLPNRKKNGALQVYLKDLDFILILVPFKDRHVAVTGMAPHKGGITSRPLQCRKGRQ